MSNFHSLGNNQPHFKNRFRNPQAKAEEIFLSFSHASKHAVYSNSIYNSRYCFVWQKALDRKDIRTLTKDKVPLRKDWPNILERLTAEELLRKYGEWGTRTGKRVGNKWYVRVDLDLLELPWSIKTTLDRGFNLLIRRQEVMFIKTRKGYHVILLLDELPPNGAIYHTDKFGVKRKVGDILSLGRQAQALGSPNKEPAGRGKWAWQAKNIEAVAEIFKKYFFSIECKEKAEQKEVSDINDTESQKPSKNTEKNLYKLFKLENVRITSKQATKRANHYRVNYLDKWKNSGFFFMDSYFRDKKEIIQLNLVGDFLLMKGYKYQFYLRKIN